MNIFITPQISKNKNNSIIYTIEHNWYSYLKKLGYNVIIIPCHKLIKKKILQFKPRGLIVSGGGDIYLKNKLKINLLRDKNEKKIIKFFEKKKIPILAVCRGFQLICSLNKIKLYKVQNHVKKNHQIQIIKNKYQLNFSKINTNSFHNYGAKIMNKKFEVLAKHADGSIEIAKFKNKKFFLTMFHPERFNIDQKKINKFILNIFR